MRLVSSEPQKKVYALDKKDYTMVFVLEDMKEYTGSSNPDWKTMNIVVKPDDSKKYMNCEFLFDRTGQLMRTLMEDANGNKRYRLYHSCSPTSSPKELRKLHGKGILQDGMWIQDRIDVMGDDKRHSPKSYYYDDKTGKFLDSKGNEAPKTVVGKYELPSLLEAIGKNVSEKFKELCKEKNETPEKIDMDEDISL